MISVIVPVYNEEEAVVDVLNNIYRELEGTVEYEIVVVNDGSTDNTLERISASGIEKLRVVEHVENLGYGKALFDGIRAAKYDCIAIIDGDGSYPADKIMELYEYYPQYDMVVGARTGKQYRKGIIKRPARMLFSYLAEYTTGRKIPDVNSGLRVFRRDIVMKFQDSLCTGFSFTTTLTLIFFLNYYYVKYIPIDYFKRKGMSKVNHFYDSIRAGYIILETILFYSPIKLFLLLAFINLFIGLSLFAVNYFTVKNIAIDFAASLCVVGSFPIFCLGLLADQLKNLYIIIKDKG